MKSITKAEETITVSKAEYESLKAQVAWLMEQLKLSKRQQFGTSSEKNKPDDGEQVSLWDELPIEPCAESSEPELKEIKAYRRRKAGQVGMSKLPADLPVEVIEHELAPEEKTCRECGKALHTMGRDVRDELKLVPAHAVILRHVRHTYACRCCEKNGISVPIVRAAMPNPVIKGSFASPEAIAHIACEKFVMGSPLYRQEQDWQRKGIDLSRQLMGSWLSRATQDWLSQIYSALKERLVGHQVLHADETTLQVLNEPGKTPQSKSYIWLYRTGSDANRPIVLYDYQASRAARHPEEFLRDFSGFLHVDGYEGYRGLPESITIVGCMAHVRRKFDEALKIIPKPARADTPEAEAIRQIGQLYKLEEEFRKLPDDDNFEARRQAREQHSRPLLDAFLGWCERQSPRPKSHFGQAVSYALKQRFRLERYLLDGRLEIDNNRAERSIKPFVIGRKNWLFCNSQGGANVSTVLYSIIETAKENHLNPFGYLAFVFRNAPNLDLMHNPDAVEGLLPWNLISPTAC